MAICADCGAIAPRERKSCELCGAVFGSAPPSAPELGGEQFWVVIRCEFQCRSCGFHVPLNHLDVDGAVRCLRCGVEQVFDVDLWRSGLSAAHEVGDLAGPNPEGRFPNPSRSIAAENPHARIGVAMTCAVHHRVSGQGGLDKASLRVTAAPGFPLCEACNTPLGVAVSGGSVRASCARCGTDARYETPAAGLALYHNLVAVLAPEHRVDAADAAEEEQGDALAVRCPNCRAPIPVDGNSYFASCDFCHTQVRIRDQTMRKLVSEPKPLPWWVLFRGASEKRIALEQRIALAGGKARGQIESVPLVAHSWRNRVLRALLPAAALLAVGMIGYGPEVERWVGRARERGIEIEGVGLGEMGGGASTSRSKVSSRSPSPSPSPSRTTSTSATTSTSTSTSTLRGAGCSCRIGGRTAQLVVQAEAAAEEWELKPKVLLGSRAIELKVGEDTAPPRRVAEPGLAAAISCADDDVLIAWGASLTRWSLSDGTPRWSARLPADLAVRQRRRADPLSLSCRKLSVRRGNVVVPTSAGRKPFGVADGVPR